MEIIGLIEVRPGEGSFVTDLNIAPFISLIAPLFIKTEAMEDELLQLRLMLEVEAVERAAANAAPGQLETILETMGEALMAGDHAAGAEADIAFHKTIFALTDNYILSKAAECIGSILEYSVKFNRQKILANPQNAAELYTQHVEIYRAIATGQPESAKALIRKHLQFVHELF
jgi:GntR family transcriptional repressor for pyruvate dehydrogenase complex